jgi:alpha-galactosidase
MNRRNFIKASFLTTAGLIVGEKLLASNNKTDGYLIRIADEVSAVVNDHVVSLTRNRTGKWEYRDVIISLENTSSGIEVIIEAPDTNLSFVNLYWKINSKKSSKILNDQWERTYGDVSWHKPDEAEILPWYFIEYNGKDTNCFGVKTGAKTFCYWKLTDEKLNLCLDTRTGRKGVRLGNRKLRAAEIVTFRGNTDESPFQTARKFARIMCPTNRKTKQPVYGINDWYFSYGKNSEELILEHTKLIEPLAGGISNRPFSVIDAGWFKGTPSNPDDTSSFGDDMCNSNSKFPDMAKLADKIKNIGMHPGLWTRPLCASYKDPESLLMPLSRNSNKPILDPTIHENLERVRNYFQLYNDWGYELVKFDFTSFDIFDKWGIAMLKDKEMSYGDWNMNDTSFTNAEIVLNLYSIIREAAGSTYIIGCNTFSHLSAGLFELTRIGDDTSGNEWDRTLNMGVNTLAFRGLQQDIFYSCDADCVGLTKKVPWEKNKQWMELLAKSGTPLFISAQPDAIGTEQKEFIKECFEIASQNLPVGEPLDWMDNSLPEKWKLNGEERIFNWT